MFQPLSLPCRHGLVAAALLSSLSATAAEVGTELQVRLQSALQMHIDRTVVAGAYPVMDLKTGRVQKYYPASGHPSIYRLGETYVVCTDFRDAAGKPVDVDFYIMPKNKGFSIFHVEMANHTPLDVLAKAGVARLMD